MSPSFERFTTRVRGLAERSQLLRHMRAGYEDGARGVDLPLAIAVLALTALGIVIVHSAGAMAFQKLGKDAAAGGATFSFHFLEKQAWHAAIGILALLVGFLAGPNWLFKHAKLFFAGATLLLLLIAVPGLGQEAGGARRWLALGPVRFQPSEVAKIALIFYFAYAIVRRGELLASLRRGYLPLLLTAGVVVLPILLQPDFGMAVTLTAVTFAMLFAAGARLTHLGLTAAVAVPIGYWLIMSSDYRKARISSFLNWLEARKGEGYQVYEAMVSFASGDWTGVGLGAGPQKLGRFPEYHNDFVLAAVGEELGLVGVILVMGLFAVVVWRGLRIARRATDRTLSLLAFGITALLGVQALCHMGVVMALLPTKGLPMPFVSYGGTSLIVSLFLVGILLYVSAQAQADGTPAGADRRRAGTTSVRQAAPGFAHGGRVGVGVADFADRSGVGRGP